MKYMQPVGACPDCGKLRFITRRAARGYMNKRLPQEKFSIYKCGDYYHYGHSPWVVKRGIADRRDIADGR